jgi:squalene monooxygenase
MLTNS